MESDELDPAIVCGILKTIFLFLEGQNFSRTCETFLLETTQLGYPTVRSATAQVLILKPAVTEIVTVTCAEPDADLQCRCPPEKDESDHLDQQSPHTPVDKLDYDSSLSNLLSDKYPVEIVEYDSMNRMSDSLIARSEAASLYDATYRLPFPDQYDQTKKTPGTPSVKTLSSSYNAIMPICSEPLLREDQSTCFPCEECNGLTPISNQSIPGIPGGTEEKAPSTSTTSSTPITSNKASVTFFDETIENQQEAISSSILSKTSELSKLTEAMASSSSVKDDKGLLSSVSGLTPTISKSDSKRYPSEKHLQDASDVNVTDSLVKQDQQKNGDPSVDSAEQTTIPVNTDKPVQTDPTAQDSQSTSSVLAALSTEVRQQSTSIQEVTTAERQLHTTPSAEQSEFFELDYNKLKQDLNTAAPEVKVLLLQALRWKITKSGSNFRDKMMVDIAKHDVLGLHGNTCGNVYSSLKNSLLAEGYPNQLQEGMARLLNALASGTIGRDYLCQDDRTLRFTIIPLVSGKHHVTISDTTKEHLLATLQKLSLRSKMRVVMIESGLPEFLVEFISNKHNKVSDYCLEYTCALFMNLCLHKETRLGMHNISNYLLSMLTTFVRSSHVHCLPYINGAMYSLFNDVSIREQARNSSLYNVLLKRVKQFEGDIKQQLELIVKVLNDGKLLPPCGECRSVNEDIEVDHIEQEIDAGDTVRGSPIGDELLRTYKYEDLRGESSEKSVLCLCIPVAPQRKITVNSFCSGGHPSTKENEVTSLNKVLSTVAEIDQEIQQSQQPSALDVGAPKDPSTATSKPPIDQGIKYENQGECDVSSQEYSGTLGKELKPSTKDEAVTAKPTQKRKKPAQKAAKVRNRYDNVPPIIYEPKVESPYIRQNKRAYDQRTKYNCGCYLQMQRFVQSQCGSCSCPPAGRNLSVKVLYDSPKSLPRQNMDEDLFQSAIELIALSCCKSDVTLPTHVDCECYTTVFRSRPKVQRTP